MYYRPGVKSQMRSQKHSLRHLRPVVLKEDLSLTNTPLRVETGLLCVCDGWGGGGLNEEHYSKHKVLPRLAEIKNSNLPPV